MTREHANVCCSDESMELLQLPMHRQAMRLLLAGDLPKGSSAEADTLCRARFFLLGIPTNLKLGMAKVESGEAMDVNVATLEANDSLDRDVEPRFEPSHSDSNGAVLTADEWHALTSKLFLLYDLDRSGTLNRNEEIEQLTTNVTVKLTRQYPDMSLPSLSTIDATLAALEPINDTNAWALEKFQMWYMHEFVAEREYPN